jgi:hypothetical protein
MYEITDPGFKARSRTCYYFIIKKQRSVLVVTVEGGGSATITSGLEPTSSAVERSTSERFLKKKGRSGTGQNNVR